jgi:NAD(P)-dependent dehydrogenase (short-subunit alcohol dehydrogenase family)
MRQQKPLEQQVVVVVGASSGIGRATALRFAQRGAKVVVSARSEPGLTSLVDEIRRGGGEAMAVAADVAEFDQVKGVADRAVATYGRFDTWVHLAAVALYAPFEQTTPEEFKRTPRSLYNWLETHPAIRRGALAGAVLGAAAGLAARSVIRRG